MNVERITTLRDHIAALPPEKFNLGSWFSSPVKLPTAGAFHKCGTSACIAGWALVLFAPDEPLYMVDVPNDAAEILGLTNEQANDLFTPERADYAGEDDRPGGVLPDPLWLGDVTNEQAVKVLDHLIATGEVRWDIL